jgi:hypothetical protein
LNDDDNNVNAVCAELGEAAAEHIVLDHFCSLGTGTYSSTNALYSKKCKKIAYDECEDNISDVAERWCPDKYLKPTKLEKMQDKCEEQVDSMLPPIETNDCTLDGDECGSDELCVVDNGQCLLKMTGIPGKCQPLREMCNLSFAPVCGCDGETYDNADCANAQGANVAHEEKCERVPCTYYGVGDDTCSDSSVFCRLGEGDCKKKSASQSGDCGTKPVACPYSYHPVCGCDSETYANECVARFEGVNVMHDGEC